jgi:hypothetical protein
LKVEQTVGELRIRLRERARRLEREHVAPDVIPPVSA